MARQPKEGIDYAGWSVDIFDGDTKIDKLLDAQGWVGFSIYFYLCQMAYKFDGYFYRWGYDDSPTTARRMGGGIRSGTVYETVKVCLQIGLFDRRLFDKWSVLTSRGIQRRYVAATKKRRVHSVIKDYWLLDDNESNGFIKYTQNDDLRPTNALLQTANDDLRPTNVYKVKERDDDDDSARDGLTDELERALRDPKLALCSRAYERNIGTISATVSEDISNWIKRVTPELVVRAIEAAARNNAHSWLYVQRILERCADTGIRTAEAYDTAQRERRRQKEQESGGGNGRRRSVSEIIDGLED